MNKTLKQITLIGILTALYVVFSLTLKIPMGIGAIALDLGYTVLTVSSFKVGRWAAFVGGVGAGIESILFSPYGISYGWIVMNIIIGLICGTLFNKFDGNRKYVYCIITILLAVLIGVTAKTIIECSLYSIPYIAKIPKSAVAFGIDAVVMIIGLPIADRVNKIKI